MREGKAQDFEKLLSASRNNIFRPRAINQNGLFKTEAETIIKANILDIQNKFK